MICIDQRKRAKMQWLQYTNQNNVDSLNNVRSEASRHRREKEKEYLRGKIDGLQLINKINISETSVTLRSVSSLELTQ